MNHKANEMEVKRMAEVIRSEGSGAGTRWTQVAGAAMAGDARSKAECERLLGHAIGSQLDLYNVMRAAFEAAPHGEQDDMANRAVASANAMANPITEARPYLANRLGDLRREAGMSQAQLSKASGVNLTTLQKLENGANSLLGAKTENTLRIARALGITVEQLVDENVKNQKV